jgi:hypothetical protein
MMTPIFYLSFIIAVAVLLQLTYCITGKRGFSYAFIIWSVAWMLYFVWRCI